MKKISIFLAGLLIAFSVQAYNKIIASAVTITVNGNKNLQISVDGREYNLVNNIATGNKTTISVNNLENGQHSFLAIRTDLNTNRSHRIATTFNLRQGYDMLITVNGNGSIELIETRKIGASDNQTPMNSTNFNNLLKSVKSQRSVNVRRSLIANAFNNSNNYFSTYQVIQLLQQINSESFRLQLAKLSYRTITDRSNFSQVYDLLNNQASENELAAYVNNYTEEEEEDSDIAMSDASFNSLYQTIRQQWPVSTQMSSLTTAFNNNNNHFTVYQARQLIQLVSTENNRLQLAKLSYRSITDRNNFSQVYDLFSSQSSKDELVAYVNNYAGNNPNAAMSDASFSALYQTIQQQWPVSTQMNSLTNAFNNSNNYFTAYQARQLILLVNTDNNRLQLAKLSFRTITDRNNFSQIYDLLNSQASKDELTEYISNNTGNNLNEPMSDASFNNLYQTIQQQWPVSTQMNSLTNAFNNSNNFFTAHQARQLILLVNTESNRLQLAKLSFRSITDRSNFSHIYDLLGSQASKDELTAYLNNNSNNNPNVAMPDASFNSLYQTIQQQWPVSTQMNSLTNAFNNSNNFFTAHQARQLILLVNTESNRLQLAKLSFRSITDRSNFSHIYDLLGSQASKDELTAWLNNYTGTYSNPPMTDANFAVFYQNLQRQYLPGEQMVSLTNAFNNTSYYFTTAQVKQLIPLVSNESNKLQLAKLAYRTITDRNNFSQIYDLLSSQASRNELDEYVKAYKE